MQTNIINWLICLFLIVIYVPVMADESPINLESAAINTRDVHSIQRGAKDFATYCLVCHSLEYMAHDRIARAAGITPAKMPDKNRKWWFGATPPDLTLIARVHSADWLYTYLHVFYSDPTRPVGSNNLLVDNVNMPNPFIGLQGEQKLLVKKSDLFSETPIFVRKSPYYTVLQLTKEGSMKPDNFDAMIRDLVNFLVYASEPKRYAREKLGIWVLIFIAILFVFVYFLKREYWKSLKK